MKIEFKFYFFVKFYVKISLIYSYETKILKYFTFFWTLKKSIFLKYC